MKKPAFFSPESPAYPTLILTNVIITTFLSLMSAVAALVSNNSIQGELALSDTESIWIPILYLLGVNTTVPASSWFAHRFGNRRVYTYGVLIFTLGSLLVAISNHFFILAAARFVEGVGAGVIFPVGLALIARSFPKERVSLAVTIYIGGAFGGGLGLGVLIAGYFTQFESWRDTFLLIVPFGLLAAFSCWLSRLTIPETEKKPFDYGGFFCFATFIASLLIALTLAPIKSTDEGWRSSYIIALFLLAGVCFVATLLIERKHPNPILPLALFKDPIFATSTAAMFLLGMSLFASVSVSIDYMIDALFYEKYVTGKIAMTYGLTMAGCSMLTSQLIKFIPLPIMTFTGLGILVFSYFLNNELSWLTGIDQVIWILFLRGLGIGFALGPTTILALQGVPPQLKDSAATLLTFFRQVGGTYGGTLISVFAIRQAIFHAARFGEQANNQLPAYQLTFQNLYNKYPDPAQAKAAIIKNIEIQAYIQGLNDALVLFGYVTAIVAVILFIAIVLQQFKKRKSAFDN